MPAPAPDFDYAREFGAEYHRARRLPPRAEQWISRLRAQKISPSIERGDRVLEYGVGFGWNLAALPCAQKTGYDLTPELRHEVEAKGIRFETCEDRLPAGAFDVVLAHHVLEHVRHPGAVLRRLRTFLRPAGRLLLFVPFERERKYRIRNPRDRAHHLYSWTPASLARLVGAAGWVIGHVRLQRFRFDRIAAVLAARLRGGFGLYCAIRAAALTLLPEYEICLLARPAGGEASL